MMSSDLDKNRGIIEIIILIIIALVLMNYFGLTVSGVVDWVFSLFRNVLR